MRKDRGDYRRIFDGGYDPQGAAPYGALYGTTRSAVKPATAPIRSPFRGPPRRVIQRTPFEPAIRAGPPGAPRQPTLTHAGVVIATTAILDNLLEHALKRAMIPLSNEFYGRLFGGAKRAISQWDRQIASSWAQRRSFSGQCNERRCA